VIAGGVHRWTAAGVETLLPDRRRVGGLELHADGGYVATGRDVVHVTDGGMRVLFSLEDTLGFNDVAADAEGRILVGSMHKRWGRLDEGRAGDVWRLGATGAEVLLDDVDLTNGVAFAPEGDVLYVADTARRVVHRARLADGEVVGRDVFVTLEEGHPDGVVVDAEGGVWVATFDGGTFDRFGPDGTLVDRIQAPGADAVTMCFGGDDLCDLYLATADISSPAAKSAGAIHRTRVPVGGVPRHRVAV